MKSEAGSGLTARATTRKPTAAGKSAPGSREGAEPCAKDDRSDGRVDAPNPGQGGGTEATPRPSTADLPRLAMAPEHGAAIVRLAKTSTMRTKPQPGRYLVEGRPKHKCDPPLRAAVTLTHVGEVWWTQLSEAEQVGLAAEEGYAVIHPPAASHEVRELARAGAVARFLRAVRSIYARGGVAERWIKGERSLHKHRISEVEVLPADPVVAKKKSKK